MGQSLNDSSGEKSFFEKLKSQTQETINGLEKIALVNPWPQTQSPTGDLKSLYPNWKTKGWLPPTLIEPRKELQKAESENSNEPAQKDVLKSYGQYTFTDWRGQQLKLPKDGSTTEGKFGASDAGKSLPKPVSDLPKDPYSTRDHYLLFNDTSTDYFRHGLQVLDGINTLPGNDFWETQNSKETAGKTRLGSFKSTPFENNDPVMFGFDIIIDDISSPLLNGSINDFLQLFGTQISEISSRIQVYEEFKQQFIKFFKTRATVRVDDSQTSITKMNGANYASVENNKGIFGTGRKAYLNYYLKSVAGLEKLVEYNTPSEKNFLTDYNKDVITLSFLEDVSLSIGTLAHLYKLLYWSKPNGKGMIPENLLRFNCDIIISEVRNFNRVRKSIETGDIEVIKDNVSRYIYSLKECQFYFNTMPHDGTVDISQIKVYDAYTVQFDYKFSTTKLERFVPTTDGFGVYVGYDGGAMWRIGAPGNRETPGAKLKKSTPNFFTVGLNKYNQNGVDSPIILNVPTKSPSDPPQLVVTNDIQRTDSGLDNLKKSSEEKRKDFKKKLENRLLQSIDRETKTAKLKATGILNKTLNKILIGTGINGIAPPKNVYKGKSNALTRVFYDVRGELTDFLGESFKNLFK